MPDTVAAPFHALANETWSIVLGSLPLHDLASSSHVSRTWQALAFPHLYHTVYLTAARHLEDISTRVSLDQGGPLSLRDAVRGLVIDQKETVTGELVTEADVGRLVKLLPELLRLEHFSWETTFVPRNLQLADVLQSKCPNLKSVGWMINNDSELTLHNRRNTYIKMLKFKNLSHFRLMVREIPPEFDDDYGSPLSDLLQACPNLVSIELELNGDEEFLHWSPDRLVAPLGSSSLPSLRVFRALGAAVPGWSEFFDSPDDSPLRTFFSRHPKLHTLGLGWVTGESYDDEIDPSIMEDLFPSLRHLEAPAFFCAPVIASSLGPRLESLAVTDEYYDSSSSPSTIANAIQPLPMLRKLELRATNENSIEAEALKALLGAAPNLKELYFPVPLDEPSEFLDVLRAAPGLKLLRIAAEEALTGVQEELGVSSWKECIPALAEICPHLGRIDNVGGFDAKSYKVERNPDGNVGLTESNSGS